MKICFVFAALAATLLAQPTIPPDTVVAKVEGKLVTAGELQKMLDSAPPQFFEFFQKDPSLAIAQFFEMRHLGKEADKLKILEESPWKELFEFMRNQLLTQAMITREQNSYPVTSDQIDAYYAANRSKYEQAKVKAISIGFKPGAPAAALSSKDVQDAARAAFAAAHAQGDRSEADARALAADLVKKLRAGADFAELVAKYSDDKDSKAAGGDFGTVKFNSSYPDEMKKAIFALKPGEVSDPVRQATSFYIIRVEEKSAQPLAELREAIILAIRNDHVRQFITDLQRRFTPTIEKPEFFLQFQGQQKPRSQTPGKP